MEPKELQGSCLTARNASGCRSLEQQKISDHWTRRPDWFPHMVPSWTSSSNERQQDSKLKCHQPVLFGWNESLHSKDSANRHRWNPKGTLVGHRRVPREDWNIELSLPQLRLATPTTLHRWTPREHHPTSESLPTFVKVQWRQREGIQILQGQLNETFRNNKAAKVHHSLHQAVH